MSIYEETEASRQHLELLIAKRNRLNESIEDTRSQLLERFCVRQTPREAVKIYDWAKSCGVTGFVKPLMKSWGTSVQAVDTWRVAGEEGRGTFPIGYQWLPPKGIPCVYLLSLTGVGVVYIGSSQKISQRLRQHWITKERGSFDRFEIIECETKGEMLQLEADLIFSHQPRLNVALKNSRGFIQ